MVRSYYNHVKRYLSEKLGVAYDRVKVVEDNEISFLLTQVNCWVCKAIVDGDVYPIYINKENYVVTESIQPYRIVELQEEFNKYGKLQKELYYKISDYNNEKEFDVWVWLKAPDTIAEIINKVKQKYPGINFKGERPDIKHADKIEQIQKDIIEEKRKKNLDYVSNIVNVMKKNGIKVKNFSEYSPSVYLSIKKSELKKLESMDKVEKVYLSINYPHLTSTALSTVKTYELWNRGYNGGISAISTTSENLVVEILIDGLNVRTGPGTGFGVIQTVNTGEFYSVVRWDNSGWVEIHLNRDKTGWVFMNNGNYAVGRYPATGEVAVVTADVLNIRQGPGTTYTVLETIYRNAELIVLEVESSWTRIKTMQGTVGWVSNTYINRVITGQSPTNRQVNVAVVESNGIDFSNPYLAHANGASFIANEPYNQTQLDPHPTAVAGCICAIERGVRGMSPSIKLYNANARTDNDSDVVAATEGAINWGVSILNYSIGTPTGGQMSYLSRYLDHVARQHFKTVVVSAGNVRTDPDGTQHWEIQSPAIGYNVLAVGAMADNDTGDWSDDTIATAFTSNGNPISPNGDRHKPDISAPGVQIFTTVPMRYRRDLNGDGVKELIDDNIGYTSFGEDYSGTSFSSPITAGIAALLQEVSVDLVGNPELTRAVLMAGATHQVSTNTVVGKWDAREGVGTVNAYTSYNILINGRYDFGFWGNGEFPRTYNVSLQAGERIRAVLTWDAQTTTNADHSDITDIQQNNLDIILRDTNGNTLDSSTSIDNTVEIVEYTASTSMTVTIRITATTYNSTGDEPAAIAWNIY